MGEAQKWVVCHFRVPTLKLICVVLQTGINFTFVYEAVYFVCNFTYYEQF